MSRGFSFEWRNGRTALGSSWLSNNWHRVFLAGLPIAGAVHLLALLDLLLFFIPWTNPSLWELGERGLSGSCQRTLVFFILLGPQPLLHIFQQLVLTREISDS